MESINIRVRIKNMCKRICDYLALKTGSTSALGCVLRVYLISKASAERPGTFKSLKKRSNAVNIYIYTYINADQRIIVYDLNFTLCKGPSLSTPTLAAL